MTQYIATQRGMVLVISLIFLSILSLLVIQRLQATLIAQRRVQRFASSQQNYFQWQWQLNHALQPRRRLSCYSAQPLTDVFTRLHAQQGCRYTVNQQQGMLYIDQINGDVTRVSLLIDQQSCWQAYFRGQRRIAWHEFFCGTGG